MAKGRIFWPALCALLLVTLCFAAAPAVLAQSTDCGGAPCVAGYDFAADAQGWSNLDVASSLTWLASKSFGWLWWTTSADGVIHGTQPTVRIYLTPGYYRAEARLAADAQHGYYLALGQNWQNLSGTWTITSAWAVYQVGGIYIAQPGYYSFEFVNSDPSVTASIDVDHLYLFEDTGFVPTSQPTVFVTVGPGTPTSTPIPPTTPTATAVAATPFATSTPVCQSAVATATPLALPQYGITPTATATPAWAYYENFDDNLNANFWTMNNLQYAYATGLGRNNSAYSLRLPASNLPSLPASSLSSQGIVFSTGSALPATVYVNAWAEAQFVPEGVTFYLDVLKLEGGSWSLVESVPVSDRSWYPFQVTVASSGGTAIAFQAHRSDSVESYDTPVFLDDVYLYTSAGDMPYCDGSFPSGAISIGAADNNPYTSGTGDRYFVTVPSDRDCPPDQIVPNNIYGYLLSGLIRFLDVTFGPWPTHQPGQTAQLVANLISSPVITFATLACIFIDLRVQLLVAGLVLTLEGAVRPGIAVYHFIKSLLPW